MKLNLWTQLRTNLYKVWKKLPPVVHPRFWTVHIPYCGSVILASPFRNRISFGLCVHGYDVYEPETIRFFKDIIATKRMFFDIGAHIGTYTLLAKCCNTNIQIVAFEPEPLAFSPLQKSITKNGWQDVVLEQQALSDIEGTLTLYVKGAATSTNPAFRGSAQTVAQECTTTRLDTYCAQHNIDHIDLLKIDTESTEPTVLAGGREIIGDCKPDMICEVLYGRTEQVLMEFLAPFGYHYFHIQDKGLVPVERLEGDRTYKHLNFFFTVRPHLEQ
jgi:FkbM family methyltransferase